MKTDDNNRVELMGKITEDFVFLYKREGNRYYKSHIQIEKKKGTRDIIPIVVPEELFEKNSIKKASKGKYVKCSGQFKSHNIYTYKEDTKPNDINNKSVNEKEKTNNVKDFQLWLYVFITEIHILEKEEGQNDIWLEGVLCKNPICKNVKGSKTCNLVYILLKVKNENEHADYIPCVAWYQDARFLSHLKAYDDIKLRCRGRIQSKQFFRKEDNDWITLCEVSLRKVRCAEREDEE